jgi:hypothetical protein
VISPWVLREIRDNLRDRSDAAREWKSLRRRVIIETDEFIFEWPLLFEIAKDKPVLVTALASADVLLTLDRRDLVRSLARTSTVCASAHRENFSGKNAKRDG